MQFLDSSRLDCKRWEDKLTCDVAVAHRLRKKYSKVRICATLRTCAYLLFKTHIMFLCHQKTMEQIKVSYPANFFGFFRCPDSIMMPALGGALVLNPGVQALSRRAVVIFLSLRTGERGEPAGDRM